MFYTSYFARISKLPNDILPVSIARFTPQGIAIPKYLKLAPSASLLNVVKAAKLGACRDVQQDALELEYSERYYNTVLRNLSPFDVVEELCDLQLVNSKRAVCLCCYERPDDLCHRHFVAKWLTDAGIPCSEYQFG